MKKVKKEDLTEVVGGNLEPLYIPFPDDDGGDNPVIPLPPLPKDPIYREPVQNPGIRWPPRIPGPGGVQ